MLQVEAASLFLSDGSVEQPMLRRVLIGTEHDGPPTEISISRKTGLIGHCAHYGTLINVEEAHLDPRYNPLVDRTEGSLIPSEAYDRRSILTVPLKDQEDIVVGVLQLTNRIDGQPFDKSDEISALSLAMISSKGIRNAQGYKSFVAEHARMQQQNKFQKQILKSQLVLSPPIDLRAVAQLVASELWKLCPCMAVRVELLCGMQLWVVHSSVDDNNTDTVTCQWKMADGDESSGPSQLKTGEGIVGRCIEAGTVIWSDSIHNDERFQKEHDSLSNVAPVALCVVPLLAPGSIEEGSIFKVLEDYNLLPGSAHNTQHGVVVGVIQLLDKSSGAFSKNNEETLQVFSEIAAAALLRAVSCLELSIKQKHT